MSRLDELNSTENPVTKYIKWKSNDKNFEAYDRSTKEKSVIDLPLEFVFLKTSATIKGWSDSNDCGIYSNQVQSTQNEILTVKAGDVKIASGLYRDIKDSVKAAGGKFHLNVYGILSGEIVVIELKGSALMEWTEFFKRSKSKLQKLSVLINTFNEGKKGAVKFTTPKFSLGKEYDGDLADKAYDSVKDYLVSNQHDDVFIEEKDKETVHITGKEEDDLPF